MYKKTIAIMSVLVVVFLCSSNIYAASTVLRSKTISLYYTSGVSGYLNVQSYTSAEDNINTAYIMTNHFRLELVNTTPNYQWISADRYQTVIDTGVTNYFSTYGMYASVENLNGCQVEFLISGRYLYVDVIPSERIIMTPYGSIDISFDLNLQYDYNPNNPIPGGYFATLFDNNSSAFNLRNSPNFTEYTLEQLLTVTGLPSNVLAYLDTIQYQLDQILQSYNSNVPIAEDSTLDSQSSQTTSEQQHQVELSQFNNTNTALSNSGINNYHFNNEQIGGIGGVSNDFTAVFNSLSSWNTVYIFALTLSLALAIIRHIRPKRSNYD